MGSFTYDWDFQDKLHETIPNLDVSLSYVLGYTNGRKIIILEVKDDMTFNMTPKNLKKFN